MYISINIYLYTYPLIYLNYYEVPPFLILSGHLDKGINQMIFRFTRLSSFNYILKGEDLYIKHIFPLVLTSVSNNRL